MSPVVSAIVVGVVMLAVDGAMHIRCHKVKPIALGCRVVLFAVGFSLSFSPLVMLIGVGMPKMAVLIPFGIFTGATNSVSLDIQRAYLQKRRGK
jgi:hypothetical protein